MSSLTGELLLASFGSAFEPLQSAIFKESLHEEEIYNKNSQTMISTEHELNLKVSNTETWKNFPFPPTPPTSPISSPYPMDTNEERFQPVCGEFDDESFFAEEEYIPEDDKKLKSMLIKDCMWNGASNESTEKRRRFSRLERIRLLCQTPPLVECTARIVSVDPSEVFPYPLNGCAQTDEGEEIVERDDESEEEVEVDVETVENGSIKQEEKEDTEGDTKTLEAEPVELSEPLKELTTENIMKDEEYEIKEERDEEDEDEFGDSIRSLRRVRKSSSPPESPSKPKKAKYSSSGESNDESEENDSEYARATHNVLERKRRNDLKLRFQRLRDSVPELRGNDRAPKVAILRKSWEFIKHLKEDERKLVTETERQKRINALLLKRLLMLNQGKQ